MARYDPLTAHLQQQLGWTVRLSFADVERIVGRKLPASAMRQRSFWSNNAANNVMTRAWLAAGFRSEQVDLAGQTVMFRKQESTSVTGFNEAQAPFEADDGKASTFPLFGWQKGTITFAPDLDLTEPADPELADYLDEHYGPYEPAP